jgi:hypothetical protein
MIEAVRTSEMSVYFNETTRDYILEGREKLKSHIHNLYFSPNISRLLGCTNQGIWIASMNE